MSLLFPEQRVIALAAVDPTFGVERWHGAAERLKSLPFERSCRVTVVLPNEFVRYAIVPWSDALATPAEEEAYVRHHFAKVHGERAKEWALRASADAAGAPRLASAVDRKLIEAIRACFAAKGKARLVSVQPQLMYAFNRWRRSIPRSGAWLVMAEAERACVALHTAGRWRAVQNAKGAWRALLDLERHRVDGEVPDLVLLEGAAAPSNDGQWKFKALAA